MLTSEPESVWGGQQSFSIVGTECDDDTLLIESNSKQTGQPMRLTLPTLCITYANMAFSNAVGGHQSPYPASAAYGPRYFDPPIELTDASEIEKFTWIRGAGRVVIGPLETFVEWFPWRTLVVPRLRIRTNQSATAVLVVPETQIFPDQPLIIKVKQYSCGRHVGGFRIEKRHPEWRPPEKPQRYDLWVRVINGKTREPLSQAALNLLRWDSGAPTPYGDGGFRLTEQHHTDGNGVVHKTNCPSNELVAVTLHLAGWRAVARCFRPLPGQRVRFQMNAWRLSEAVVRYTWKETDVLEDMALLTGRSPGAILDQNRLTDPSELSAGMSINLPCYEASYRLERGDSFNWLARAFAYASDTELAKLNGVSDLAELARSAVIRLPGWHFFYARQGDTLERLDALFALPVGWSRTVGRVHHPDSRLPYIWETIAVPTKDFVGTHSL